MGSMLAALDHRHSLVIRLARMFQTEGPNQMAELHEALAARDAPLLASRAHRLKGGLTNFAYPTAVRLASAVESRAQAGDLSSLTPLMSQLAASVDSILIGLEAYLQQQEAR